LIHKGATTLEVTYEPKAEIFGKLKLIQATTEKLCDEQALEGLARSEAANMNLAEAIVLPLAAAVLNITEVTVLPLAAAVLNTAEMTVLPLMAVESARVVVKLPPREAPHPHIGALGVNGSRRPREAG